VCVEQEGEVGWSFVEASRGLGGSSWIEDSKVSLSCELQVS
jgi:hypothetical protein